MRTNAQVTSFVYDNTPLSPRASRARSRRALSGTEKLRPRASLCPRLQVDEHLSGGDGALGGARPALADAEPDPAGLDAFVPSVGCVRVHVPSPAKCAGRSSRPTASRG